MKKLILLFTVIGFVATAAITKMSKTESITTLKSDKNKACIDACNKCVADCKEVEKKCGNDAKMAEMKKLCRECIVACDNAVKAMKAGKDVKAECSKCADICAKCAKECDKHDMADCKKCAEDCRSCEKLCREM